MIIQHRPGKKHANADGLSRIPDNLEACDYYSAGAKLECLPCGGCDYCCRAQRSWGQFETDIDDVIPLAMRKVAETDVNNAQKDHYNWMEGRSPRDIIAEQEKDSDLCRIIQWLKNYQVPSEFELQLCSPAAKHWKSCNSQLKFKDGVLVYEWLDTVPPKLLVMVPKSMKQEVLINCHNTKIAGYFGQQKTYNKLKSKASNGRSTLNCQGEYPVCTIQTEKRLRY
ncbi:unnamed protein product [Mytilus coruscus]|uniref:Integrase zinc-binding domain-containing protein n=1 Tax=Mytilus coruscus TaxID=42192 RepID=A0A6J8DI67_MYTCO|nr:unnamed protein product [Mytilus coruscus]